MKLEYDIIVQGNNLKLANGFLGISNVTLIKCSGGPILVDTGGYTTRLALLDGLKKHGLTPTDIPVVFLTHLHFDHAHNIDFFPHAKIIISKREFEYAADPHPADLFIPWGLHGYLENWNLEFIDGSGRIEKGVEFFPAPGHTPGSYALKLTGSEVGNVVVAGDAIKYIREVIQAQCDMAFDTPEIGTASIKKIISIADRIIPGHFQELIRSGSDFVWEDPVEFSLLVR